LTLDDLEGQELYRL